MHIIQSAFGSAELLWDYDEDDLFLPDWGRPGAIGNGLAQYPTDATRDVLPIPCHSHNDYWRRIPLLEAIHWGCTSVEADVWLFDDDLFVGHAITALTRERTLRTLYIEPLLELLDSMNTPGNFANDTRNGIFDEDHDQSLVLLVDIKSDSNTAYRRLEEQLEPLRKKDYLTYHDGKKLVQRPVTVVGTGSTPFNLIESSTKRRDIFFDAPLDLFWEVPASPIVSTDSNDKRPMEMDYATAMIRAPANKTAAFLTDSPAIDPGLGQGHVGVDPTATADSFDNSNSYYASTSFAKSIGFVWRGHLSPRQMEILRGQIRGAKRRGLKVRYWDTPSWPVSARNHIWQVLMDEGADVLNVDDLKAAATEDWRRRVHRWWS